MPALRSSGWFRLAILAIASLVQGCAPWGARDEASDAEKAAWAQHFRKPTAKGQLFGATSRSQQVERNLGIR